VREVEGVLLCTETFAFLLSDVDACILARGLPHSSKNRVRQSMSSCTQMSMSLCARGLMISVSRVLPSCSTPPPPLVSTHIPRLSAPTKHDDANTLLATMNGVISGRNQATGLVDHIQQHCHHPTAKTQPRGVRCHRSLLSH
jgi:hypothetical protein